LRVAIGGNTRGCTNFRGFRFSYILQFEDKLLPNSWISGKAASEIGFMHHQFTVLIHAPFLLHCLSEYPALWDFMWLDRDSRFHYFLRKLNSCIKILADEYSMRTFSFLGKTNNIRYLYFYFKEIFEKIAEVFNFRFDSLRQCFTKQIFVCKLYSQSNLLTTDKATNQSVFFWTVFNNMANRFSCYFRYFLKK